jgi:preprotein translocase subunit SecY
VNWKIIGKSLRDSDMRQKILIVIGIVVVFRFLAHIPIPLADSQTLRQVLENLFNSANTPQFLSFVNVLSGGALANFSIMLVGLGPYINASIIMQLLTRAVPKLETMNKEGEYGRKKINQMTRILTLPLAIIQSVGTIYLVKTQASQVAGLGNITANASLMQWVLMVAALTGGAMILMWLGELITEQNIGNGISILITVGIISTLPQTTAGLISQIFAGDSNWNILGFSLPISERAFFYVGLITLALLAIIVAVVRLNEAQRKLTVNYAKRVQGNRAYGGVTTVLPIKIISAGVIPIIFAVAFLSVPSFVGQIMVNSDSARLQELGTNLITWFQNPSQQTFAAGGFEPFIYPIVYFALVFLFTFFYTSITFNAKDVAENLQKQGAFIADVRSGAQTEKYLTKIVNRLTLFGAIAIGLLAVLPIAGEYFFNVQNFSISGTSILILVAVALDTLRKVESQALMVTYSQYDGSDFFQEVEVEEKKRRLRIPNFRRNK